MLHKYVNPRREQFLDQIKWILPSCSKLKLNFWCGNVDLQKPVQLLQVKVDYEYLHGCFSVVWKACVSVCESINFIDRKELYWLTSWNFLLTDILRLWHHTWLLGTRLKIMKMVASLWGGNMTLNCDISRTSWHMKALFKVQTEWIWFSCLNQPKNTIQKTYRHKSITYFYDEVYFVAHRQSMHSFLPRLMLHAWTEFCS